MLCIPFLPFLFQFSKNLSSHPDVKDSSNTKQSLDPSLSDEFLICRQCRMIITIPQARITIQGSSEHTFANPHGIVFEIDCYAIAPGCIHIGKPTSEFTWFNGYMWVAAICRQCSIHLGWHFIPMDNSQHFYALIHDRLLRVRKEDL
ncbi:MAG: hypothetical protein HQK77_03770 [Desulfobacterales bacterium]|nr:hypothetical protein [Desulfobacterales bacterium]